MKNCNLIITLLAVIGINSLSAQNPIIRDQFTADPSARVFNGESISFPISPDAWIQYNSVDFGNKKYKKAQAKVRSENGGIIQLYQYNAENHAIAEITIPKGNQWKTIGTKVSGIKSGVHNLMVVHKKGQPVEVDWVKLTD